MNIITRTFPEYGNVTVFIPDFMANFSMEHINSISNSCGREGLEEHLVPDHLLGLDISICCRIHDIMYTYASQANNQDDATMRERLADGILAANLSLAVMQTSENEVIKWARLKEAFVYVDFVGLTDIVKPGNIEAPRL